MNRRSHAGPLRTLSPILLRSDSGFQRAIKLESLPFTSTEDRAAEFPNGREGATAIYIPHDPAAKPQRGPEYIAKGSSRSEPLQGGRIALTPTPPTLGYEETPVAMMHCGNDERSTPGYFRVEPKVARSIRSSVQSGRRMMTPLTSGILST